MLNALPNLKYPYFNRGGQLIFHRKNVNEPGMAVTGERLATEAFVYVISTKGVSRLFKGQPVAHPLAADFLGSRFNL